MADLRTAHPTVFNRTGVDCSALFRGDQAEQKLARDYLYHQHVQKKLWTSTDYIREAKNCSRFRRMRGYFSQPLSQEEADFPIAFSILMYANVQQVFIVYIYILLLFSIKSRY